MPVTVAVPGATPVKIALQVPPLKVQLAATVPTAVLDEVNVTVPVGVLAGVVVSATVAAHVEVPPMLMEARLQTTVVDVLSLLV